MNNRDQWTLEGDCNKCRKVKYCKKACKAHKGFLDRKLNEAIDKTPAGAALRGINDYLSGKYR